MASGKQTSFQYGELSPAQRFKASSVHFSEGLAKLRNMFVRRDGGVSNRSGFKLASSAPSQYGVKDLVKRDLIKTVVFGGAEFTIVTMSDGSYATRLLINGSEYFTFYFEADTKSGGKIHPPGPTVVMIPTKEGLYIPRCTFSEWPTSLNGFDINSHTADILIDNNGYVRIAQRNERLVLTYTAGHGFKGLAPFLPVSYLVTATLKDGKEVRVHDVASTGFPETSGNVTGDNPSGNSLCYPHAQLTCWVNITLDAGTDLSRVKTFNLYRGSGQKGYGKTFYKLAGRVPCDGETLALTFSDYGADDPYTTPPIDFTYFDYFTGGPDRPPFYGAKVGTFYQQRLLIAGDLINGLKKGEVLASALGAPLQLAGPIISSNTGAFVFSLPINDGSAVTGMLSMERCLIGSENGVYVLRGGEQGILTPGAVNPVKISDEGWSSKVEATMSGHRGFWVNSQETKLMFAQFRDDGNLAVSEASLLSNHLLRDGIKQLVALSSPENILYALTRKGKIVRVTVGMEDGVFGFSLYETNGYVESIWRGFNQTLYAYVIRNGVRNKEVISERIDDEIFKENYADFSLDIGTKLAIDEFQSVGYIKSVSMSPWINWRNISPYDLKVNIESGSHSWGAYETIKVQSNINLFNVLSGQDFRIHFFYDIKGSNGDLILDRNGRPKTRFIRFVPDMSTPVAIVAKQELNYEGLKIETVNPSISAFQIVLFDPSQVGGPAVTPGSEIVDVPSTDYISVAVDYNGSTILNVFNALSASAAFNALFNVSLSTSGSDVITSRVSEFSNLTNHGLAYEFEGHFESDVPEELRDVKNQFEKGSVSYERALTRWAPAFDRIIHEKNGSFNYLGHLKQMTESSGGVSIVADEQIKSSPLNPSQPKIFVQENNDEFFIEFGDFVTQGYIGVPYMSEMETLDIEAGDNRTLTDAKKLINAVGVGFMETRGGFFGMPNAPLEDMEELRSREDGDMFAPSVNLSGHKTITVPGEWSEHGRVNIKNVDPVPMTILSVYPKGISGD